jgi:hypothetical protein
MELPTLRPLSICWSVICLAFLIWGWCRFDRWKSRRIRQRQNNYVRRLEGSHKRRLDHCHDWLYYINWRWLIELCDWNGSSIGPALGWMCQVFVAAYAVCAGWDWG